MKSSKQVSLIPKQCISHSFLKKDACFRLLKLPPNILAIFKYTPFNILLFPECMNRGNKSKQKHIYCKYKYNARFVCFWNNLFHNQHLNLIHRIELDIRCKPGISIKAKFYQYSTFGFWWHRTKKSNIIVKIMNSAGIKMWS